MGVSAADRESGNAGIGGGRQQRSQPENGPKNSGDAKYTQTLYILVFRGQPQDNPSTRATELYLLANDANQTRCTFRLKGQPGRYRVEKGGSTEPVARSRPNLIRDLHVLTRQTTSVLDMTLRDAIVNVPVRNEEPDWNCQAWVGDVVVSLQNNGLITKDEGFAAIDAMVNHIVQ